MKRKLITLTLAGTILISGLQRATPEEPQGNDPQLVGYICGGVVIVGGIYVVIKLRQLCKRLLPPPIIPAPQPPPATNCPPRIPTNAPPTNPPARRFAMDVPDPEYTIHGLETMATNSAWHDPFGQPYYSTFTLNLETSTNLVHWQTHSLTGWVSEEFVLLSLGTNVWATRRDSAGDNAWLDLGGGDVGFVRVKP